MTGWDGSTQRRSSAADVSVGNQAAERPFCAYRGLLNQVFEAVLADSGLLQLSFPKRDKKVHEF